MLGPGVAPGHPHLHGGAQDLGLLAVAGPVQCHLPPSLQRSKGRVEGGVRGALGHKPCTSFGLPECIKVLGGDRELALPGMWFNWATPYDIITAWRKVGIAANVLRPELIDRSEFITQPAAAPATPAAAAPMKRAAEVTLTLISLQR